MRWLQWQTLAQDLNPLLTEPGQQPNFLPTLQAISQQLQALTHQDGDVAIFHLVHATPDKVQRYGVLHAMHTAMLMALIGQRKDWSPARLDSAVKAALTMNIAITDLQSDLAQQATPLSPAQRDAIRHHPTASGQLLRELGVQDSDWLEAVEQHHEQPDGQGYPGGLTALHPLADALRTCDIFGAKLSPRANRPGMLSPKAAAEIFRQRSAGYFGATIIRELGLYPPGCLVDMSTGETAIVLRRTRDPMAPDVVLLCNASGHPLAPLARCATSREPGRHIVAAASLPHGLSPIDAAALMSLA